VGRADKKNGKENQTMITLSGRAIEKLQQSNLESSKDTLRVFISGIG
jgi:hypothetical protein